MTKLFMPLALMSFILLIQSCSVPQDYNWLARDSEYEYVDMSDRSGKIKEETTLFDESMTNDGKKKYIFKTNDSKYISSENVRVWKITDSSTPYPTTVCATVSCQSGSSSVGSGILFAARKKSGKDYFLTVMINIAGQYMIGKNSEESFTVIKDWTRCDSIKKGYGMQNAIKVTLAGSVFNVYINNILADSFQDTNTPILSTGAHGYIVLIPSTEKLPQKFVETAFIE